MCLALTGKWTHILYDADASYIFIQHTWAGHDLLKKGFCSLCTCSLFITRYFNMLCTHLILSWVSCLFQIDLIWFIVYSQVVRTRQFLDSVTHIVFDVDREIVLFDDFLDQNICAVSLESIILPIKSDIMWISPTITFACNKNKGYNAVNAPVYFCLLQFKAEHNQLGISEL